MPKGWSSLEKERIRKTLREGGRKLFERLGLQKTTVDDLVAAAHISKGAFYHFYDSKEALYFDLVEEVETEFREEVFKSLREPGPDKQKAFRAFLLRAVQLFTSMPMLRQFRGAEFEALLRSLPPKTLERHMAHDTQENEAVFRLWMDRGWMRQVELTALQGMLLAFFRLVIHRDDLGTDFEKTVDLLIEAMTSYLVPQAR